MSALAAARLAPTRPAVPDPRSAERSPQPAPARVTLRPAPRREPPFDDQTPRAHLRLVGPYDRPLPFAPAPAPTRPPAPVDVAGPDHLPDAGAWARRLLLGVSETAAGRRPMQQLAALLSPSVARGLGGDFERAARAGRPHWTAGAGVRTVRTTYPRAGVAELSATVAVGERVRAVALRLEAHHGRWRCTRLQWG